MGLTRLARFRPSSACLDSIWEFWWLPRWSFLLGWRSLAPWSPGPGSLPPGWGERARTRRRTRARQTVRPRRGRTPPPAARQAGRQKRSGASVPRNAAGIWRGVKVFVVISAIVLVKDEWSTYYMQQTTLFLLCIRDVRNWLISKAVSVIISKIFEIFGFDCNFDQEFTTSTLLISFSNRNLLFRYFWFRFRNKMLILLIFL